MQSGIEPLVIDWAKEEPKISAIGTGGAGRACVPPLFWKLLL